MRSRPTTASVHGVPSAVKGIRRIADSRNLHKNDDDDDGCCGPPRRRSSLIFGRTSSHRAAARTCRCQSAAARRWDATPGNKVNVVDDGDDDDLEDQKPLAPFALAAPQVSRRARRTVQETFLGERTKWRGRESRSAVGASAKAGVVCCFGTTASSGKRTQSSFCFKIGARPRSKWENRGLLRHGRFLNCFGHGGSTGSLEIGASSADPATAP